MKVPNPMPFFGKVRAQVLLKNGKSYGVSASTDREFEVEEDAVEVIIVSSGNRGRVENVWTPEKGLQDKDEYFQHKQLKAQVKELEKQKEKMLRDKAKAVKEEKRREKEREEIQVTKDEVQVSKDRMPSKERPELCDRVESDIRDSC